jgi:hypothetical protein
VIRKRCRDALAAADIDKVLEKEQARAEKGRAALASDGDSEAAELISDASSSEGIPIPYVRNVASA